MPSVALAADTLLSRHPDLVAGLVDGETLVMHMDSGKYFQLDPIGAEILDLLADPLTLDDLAARLMARYRVDAPTLEADLLPFLQQLETSGVIVMTHPGTRPSL